jgi:hypothetical protein
MKREEAVKMIRVMLGIDAPAPVEVKFVDATLADGTKVTAEGDAFVPGATLYVVTPEGNVTAPEGEHTLEDGTIVQVDAQGVIIEVAAATEDATPEEPAAPATPAAMEDQTVAVPDAVAPAMTEEVVQAVVDALTPIVEQLQTVQAELAKMKVQFSAFSAEPAAAPLKKNNFSEERANAQTLQEKRMNALIEIRNKKK